MKKALTALISGVFVFALANCGGSGGGGSAAAPAPVSDAANGATEIQYYGDSGVITWDKNRVNIYVESSRPNCVFGISQGSSDTNITSRMQELVDLINSSTIGKGTLDVAGESSRYLSVNYGNGETRVFNLDNDQAAKDEETLSKGVEIVAFFNSVDQDLDNPDIGKNDCPGKGDK